MNIFKKKKKRKNVHPPPLWNLRRTTVLEYFFVSIDREGIHTIVVSDNENSSENVRLRRIKREE